MKGATTRTLFAAHSATGIALGALLYVVCLTGTLALFVGELMDWAHPPLRDAGQGEPAAADALVGSIADRLDGGAAPLVILEPAWRPDAAQIHWRRPGDPANRRVVLDRATARPLPLPRAGVPLFLEHLHTDLLLPKPWGRYLVGLTGMAMLLSAITGVLVHRKPARQAFTLRTGRSRLLAFTDWHKVTGLWGLPFHLMIAYTGALLGLAGLLIALTGAAAFDGDTGAARAAFNGRVPPAAGEPAEPASLDAIAADARARFPGHAVERLIVWHRGDAASTVRVDLQDPATLSTRATRVLYDGADGTFRRALPLEEAPGRRAYAAVTPLHYGDYGGTALKIVYALLGLGGTLLTASGTLVWLERRSRRHGARGDARARPRVEGATAGFFVGLPIATAAVLHAGLLGAVPPGGTYTPLWIGHLGCWGVICLGGAVAGARRTLVLGLWATAALAAALPVVNAFATGDALWHTVASGDWGVAGVDLAALIVAAATARAAVALGRAGRGAEGA